MQMGVNKVFRVEICAESCLPTVVSFWLVGIMRWLCRARSTFKLSLLSPLTGVHIHRPNAFWMHVHINPCSESFPRKIDPGRWRIYRSNACVPVGDSHMRIAAIFAWTGGLCFASALFENTAPHDFNIFWCCHYGEKHKVLAGMMFGLTGTFRMWRSLSSADTGWKERIYLPGTLPVSMTLSITEQAEY